MPEPWILSIHAGLSGSGTVTFGSALAVAAAALSLAFIVHLVTITIMYSLPTALSILEEQNENFALLRVMQQQRAQCLSLRPYSLG